MMIQWAHFNPMKDMTSMQSSEVMPGVSLPAEVSE